MTTATHNADLGQPGDALDWYRSVSNIKLIDPFDTTRFQTDNGDCFDVHFANDVHAGTSPPNWVISDIELPNSTWMDVPYESVEPIQENQYTQNKQLIGLDVEHLVGSLTKYLVVTATVPRRLPASLNSTFVIARDDFEDSGVFDQAGLQNASWYFHKGKYREQYIDRIAYLRNEGEYEDIQLNVDSESGFWQLMDGMPDAQRAEVVLLDNGNLRVFWRAKGGDYVGVEVLGPNSIRSLMYKSNPTGKPMSLHLGPSPTNEIIREIETHGFKSFIDS